MCCVRALPLLTVSTACGLMLAAVGCASPGPPQPPSLQLPAPVTDLSARRSGDQVILSWNTPSETTDKQSIRKPITAVICREVVAHPRAAAPVPRPANAPAPCTPVERLPVVPGEIRHVQTLPAELLAEPPQLLIYRVQLQNPKGRFAPPPPQVYAASGAAPPSVGAIRIHSSREGAVVEWSSRPGTDVMELHRTLVADAKGPMTPQPVKSGKRQFPPLGTASGPRTPANETVLRPPSGDADPGGLVDGTARPPNTYTYVAERVRTVTLGRHTLEIFGEASPAVTFADVDVFPPHAPVGLVSIAGGGFDAAKAIDLSWEPNAERDLLGYNIYRADVVTGPFRKLNAEVLPGPAYRDLGVEAGHSYFYRVTALDESRHEGPPSATLKEFLPAR